MLVREFYITRSDGANLYKSYSDANMMIKQIDTGILFVDAIDVENTTHTYEETDIPIKPEEPEENWEEVNERPPEPEEEVSDG